MTRRPGPVCPVCTHVERSQIDLALAVGIESRAEIMRRYGLDRSAGFRHAHGGHIDDLLADHAAEAASLAAEGLLDRIVSLADRLDRRLATLDEVNASDSDVARLARELRGVFDLIARVSGKLIERVEVNEYSPGRWADGDVVVNQLARGDGTKLSITVEVEAESETGFGDGVQRTVTENATTLKFESSEFEN